jgi:hypothetical protein
MAKLVMIDQFQVAVLLPKDLPHRDARRVRRTLDSFRFRLRLARAIRAVVREYPDLAEVRLHFSL